MRLLKDRFRLFFCDIFPIAKIITDSYVCSAFKKPEVFEMNGLSEIQY